MNLYAKAVADPAQPMRRDTNRRLDRPQHFNEHWQSAGYSRPSAGHLERP